MRNKKSTFPGLTGDTADPNDSVTWTAILKLKNHVLALD